MLAGPIGRQARSLNASAATGAAGPAAGFAPAGFAAAGFAAAAAAAAAESGPNAAATRRPNASPSAAFVRWLATSARRPVTGGREESLHAHQLDIELERGIGRDDRRPAGRAVGDGGGNRELALASDLHAGDPFVPALDD